MHTTDIYPLDDRVPVPLDDLEALGEELPDSTLVVASGGMLPPKVILDFCYDDQGEVVDFTYIDIP